MFPVALRPEIVLTSMGKKVVAVLVDRRLRLPVEAEPHDHDQGNADNRQRTDKIAQRQQAALQERNAVDQHGDDKPGAAAHGEARQDRLDKGLLEIGP